MRVNFLKGCIILTHNELLVLITAATPVVELRGAIPLGLALDLPVYKVWILSIIGNIIPVPFILLGMNYILKQLENIPRLHAWLNRKAEKGGDKLQSNIQRWGWLGLLLFVAIPLPGTGAWTGSLAASFLRLNFWSSLLTIMAGVMVASFLVSGIGITVMAPM